MVPHLDNARASTSCHALLSNNWYNYLTDETKSCIHRIKKMFIRFKR